MGFEKLLEALHDCRCKCNKVVIQADDDEHLRDADKDGPLETEMTDWIEERLKMLVKTSASWSAHVPRVRPRTPSCPGALRELTLLKDHLTLAFHRVSVQPSVSLGGLVSGVVLFRKCRSC